MTLTELLSAVREEHLSKAQLEQLYQDFLNLFSEIELELASLEKLEALYIDRSEETTEAARKRKWRVTPEGQQLILLKRQSKVVEKQLSAVKHRCYQFI